MKRIFGQTLTSIQEKEKLAKEGLSISYNSIYLQKHLLENFGNFITKVEEASLFEEKPLEVHFKNNFEEPEDFQIRLNLFGHKVAKKALVEDNQIIYYFVPTFPVLLEKEMLGNLKVFCVVSKESVKEISKNDLKCSDKIPLKFAKSLKATNNDEVIFEIDEEMIDFQRVYVKSLEEGFTLSDIMPMFLKLTF